MIERAIEHWLTNTNERGYQIPFCQVLACQGHRVLHISSHGSPEQGKDIITLDRRNKPCAYQLKTGRIDKGKLREIQGELTELVSMPIQYPGIPKAKHAAYLVTNGDLNDVARTDLAVLNQGYRRNRWPEITAITKGQLLGDFLKVQGKFLPAEVPDFNCFLSLLLRDGRKPAAKAEISNLIESLLFRKFGRARTEIPRAMASVLILTGYVLGAHYRHENHAAIMEGWTLAAAYILAMAGRHELDLQSWEPSFLLAMHGIDSAASALHLEVTTRKHLVETDHLLYDGLVYPFRITSILGYLCAAALSRKIRGETDWVDERLDHLVASNLSRLKMWSEGAVPHLLAIAHYCRSRIRPMLDEFIVMTILDSILAANGPAARGRGLPGPYSDLESSLRITYGLVEEAEMEDFTGSSFTLRTAVDFLASRLWRQALRMRWRTISHIHQQEFIPDHLWQFYCWNNAEGETVAKFPAQRQSWAELRRECQAVQLERVPGGLQEHPEFLPFLLLAYPHRLTPNISRYFTSLL